MRPLPTPEWRGVVSYGIAHGEQRAARAAVLEGRGEEAFWLLEHPAVVTTGRRRVPVEQLPAPGSGLTVVQTERGGLATYHGPGQLVGYLILDLASRSWKVRCHIHGMEQGIIDWLDTMGVGAERRTGMPGVWVGRDKVAAVGVHVRRGVTLHGFALNLRVDLGVFGDFVPCGVLDGGVTSLHRLRDGAPAPAQAWTRVAAAVGDALIRSQCR